VTGTWYTPNGALAVGTIVFLLLESVEVPDDPDGVVIPVRTVVDVPAGVLNQTLPEGVYQVSMRLSELYRVTKVVEIVEDTALNLPDAVGMLLPDPDLYDPVRSVNGHFPDAYGNILVPGGGGEGGVTDHGALTGLLDDDHPQYHNNARGDARYAGIVHTHTIANVTGLQTALDGKQASGSYATTTDLTNGLATKQATGDYATNTDLTNGLAGKAPTVHTHSIAQVTGLQTDLTDFDTRITTLEDAPSGSTKVVHAYITTGDVTLPNTSGSWAILSGFQIAIDAAVGDWVELSANGMRSSTGTGLIDFAVNVSGSVVRYLSTGTSSPATEGDPAWYGQPSSFSTISGARGFVVESGHLDTGQIKFVVATKSAGSSTLYASTAYPFYWQVKNLGQVT
jgi:hypothetical protein